MKLAMAERKELYPLKFEPNPSKKIWGGSDLIRILHKHFVEKGEDGKPHPLTTDDCIGESWELSDMGFRDSVIVNGWLAGNTIGEVMETYFERIVGEDVMNRFGTQFPILVKFLDIQDRLSVQVHPNDADAAERYDSLGKNEIWYVMAAGENAKIYLGFNRDISAQEFYDRCRSGKVEEVLNVIRPKRGDVINVAPGIVHSAGGGILIAEIQESSDLTFRLYDWGREFDPKTARETHLDEAIDLIDYTKFDNSSHGIGAGQDRTNGGSAEKASDGTVQNLIKCPQFTVNKVNVHSPLKISTEGNFIIYICIEGEAVIQVPALQGTDVEKTPLGMGETVLIPADMAEFTLLPTTSGTQLLEVMVEPMEETDPYINPDTKPFLEGEDYEGLNEEDDEDGETGDESPLFS